MADTITYEEVKTAMATAELPTSEADGWNGVDAGSYITYAAGVNYASGTPNDVYKNNYGFAYPGEMPAGIVEAVEGANYSVTVAASPLTGAFPLSVTVTATEVGGPATSYLWSWGDGSANSTTTVHTATHSYTTAGTFTPKLTPTVAGVAQAQVSATAPVVVTGAAFSATLAGTPLTGAHASVPVVWTLTQSNGSGTSFLWDLGDGTTQTTTVPTITRTYAAAGTFTAKCTPTVGGTARTQVTAAAPAVLT